MFDEFGPRGAEDEREGFWTDLSEVPDEQYRDEDEPKQTQEVIVPTAQEPYGPGFGPPVEFYRTLGRGLPRPLPCAATRFRVAAANLRAGHARPLHSAVCYTF